MARSSITVQTCAAFGGAVADAQDNRDAADATNDHSFVHPGGEVLLVIENGSGGDLTALIKGVASPATFNRAVDTTVVTSTGKFSVVGIPDRGFDQGGGVVYIDIDADTSSYLSVYKITPTPR
jgi:hypothetical protein